MGLALQRANISTCGPKLQNSRHADAYLMLQQLADGEQQRKLDSQREEPGLSGERERERESCDQRRRPSPRGFRFHHLTPEAPAALRTSSGRIT